MPSKKSCVVDERIRCVVRLFESAKVASVDSAASTAQRVNPNLRHETCDFVGVRLAAGLCRACAGLMRFNDR